MSIDRILAEVGGGRRLLEDGSGLTLLETSFSALAPDVVHDTIAAAKGVIASNGYTVGAITFAFSTTIPPEPAGQVSSQNPIANAPAAPGSAIDLVVSLGPPTGLVKKLLQKLLLSLHRVFDKDPHQQLALRLQYDGGMTWRIADGVLTTTVTGGSGTSQSIALANFTIDSLSIVLASLPGYSVPYQDTSSYAQLSALVLIDSGNDIGTSNGDHIYGYTNTLWAYLDPIGGELGSAQAQIPNMLAQMVIPTAQDEWLDEQGSYYLVPRNSGELDPSYSPRIVTSVLQPKGNNVAIAMAIQALAPAATRVRCIDALDDLLFAILYNGEFIHNGSIFYDAGLGPNSGYGFFDIDFSYDFLGSVTQDEYLAIIESTVEKFRDAGTQLRGIIFRNLTSSTLIVSDMFIGRVRVIVYDDFGASNYRLLENGLVRLLETGDARLLE